MTKSLQKKITIYTPCRKWFATVTPIVSKYYVDISETPTKFHRYFFDNYFSRLGKHRGNTKT